MIDNSFVKAGNINKIINTSNGYLKIKYNDREIEKVRPRRLFPFTRKMEYISFLDSNGEEIFILDDAQKLDKDSVRALKHTLDRYYVIPKISRILSIEDDFGAFVWKVETDRGITEFEVRQPSISVKIVGRFYVIIKDINDNSYEIADMRNLDDKSRKLLDGQL